MNKVDVHGILERAGADADAPEGSQAWALAQVDAAVAELIKRAEYLRRTGEGMIMFRAALDNVGSTK